MKSGRGYLSDAHDDIHTKGLAGMNRNGRSKLSMAVRRLRQDSVSSHDAFIKVISRLMDDESGKLGNIPESLAGSPVSSGIEDSIDMMDEASELSEGIIEAADEIAQLCGVDASPGMTTSVGRPIPRFTKSPSFKNFATLRAIISLGAISFVISITIFPPLRCSLLERQGHG